MSGHPAADRLGRQHVANGDSGVNSSPTPTALDALIHRRVDELTAYQDDKWAARYLQQVEDIRRSEATAIGESTAITEAFARHLFKVMAYKDEYEVARLHIDPDLESQIRDEFGDGARYSILLHPPLLRAVGLKKKIRLQAWWAKPILRRPWESDLVAAGKWSQVRTHHTRFPLGCKRNEWGLKLSLIERHDYEDGIEQRAYVIVTLRGLDEGLQVHNDGLHAIQQLALWNAPLSIRTSVTVET